MPSSAMNGTNRMKILIVAASLALGLAAAAGAASIKPYIAAAVADPGRGDQKEVDARRHPAEVIAFSGVKPGDKVVDLIPGSGYFSKIFSKAVGPKGKVYMIWPNEYAKEAQPDPEENKKFAKSGYPNTVVIQ
jgi:predicted methyltransferase